MGSQRTHRTDSLEEARHAAGLLKQALDGAGIVLPSLRVDLVAVTSGIPLVELGSINATEVAKLADVLRRGTCQ